MKELAEPQLINTLYICILHNNTLGIGGVHIGTPLPPSSASWPSQGMKNILLGLPWDVKHSS